MVNNILFENQFIKIRMVTPNYPFIDYKKLGAAVIPYDKHGNIYLIEKDRPGLGKTFEAPRGFVENGETYKIGALRELKEETGLEEEKVTSLGYVQPDTGITNNPIKVFAILVDNLQDEFEHNDLADNENCKIKKFDIKMIKTMIADGTISCGISLSSLFKFVCKFNAIL